MIFCLLKGTLPIVISWSDKYLDIMEVFSLEEMVFSEDGFNLSLLNLDEIDSVSSSIRRLSKDVLEKMKSEINV